MRFHAHRNQIPRTGIVCIKQDPTAISKIQDYMPLRNTEVLKSFLAFAYYYRDFIPFHAAEVQPMQELLRKNQHFYWDEKQQ